MHGDIGDAAGVDGGAALEVERSVHFSSSSNITILVPRRQSSKWKISKIMNMPWRSKKSQKGSKNKSRGDSFHTNLPFR